jgi:hypothetical protein
MVGGGTMGSKPATTKARWWFDVAALVSAVFLGLTVAGWLIGFFINPLDHHLSVTESFHIGIESGPDGLIFGCVVFFNNGQYGPYRGSIIGLSAGPDDTLPYQRTAWGDLESSGVYYRHIYWPDSDTPLWTLAISLLYPFLLFAVVPLVWMWRRWSARCPKNRPTEQPNTIA